MKDQTTFLQIVIDIDNKISSLRALGLSKKEINLKLKAISVYAMSSPLTLIELLDLVINDYREYGRPHLTQHIFTQQ